MTVRLRIDLVINARIGISRSVTTELYVTRILQQVAPTSNFKRGGRFDTARKKGSRTVGVCM